MQTIIILGPTGSGKTEVAIKIAEKIHGEIISADSRAIYKGMDLGTAKPTKEEQRKVPHWGIDLVEPGERFTVSDWKEYVETKINEIKERGNVPIVVGGTGLYIDALIYDYQFKGPTGNKVGDSEQKTCTDRDGIKGDYLIVGIKWGTEELRNRLRQRVDKMFNQELYRETTNLAKTYSWDNQAMKSNIYEYAWQYTNGKLDLDEAKEKCFLEDWHLAKRQMTWFKRTPEITWLRLDEVYSYVINSFMKRSAKK